MDQHSEHVVGYSTYVLVWFGLISLTILTVAFAGIDLGRWLILTSLGIATTKTLLVVNVFMHLKFEHRIFRIFVLVAIVTLAIFIGMTFFDYAFY
jgi:cytochrome c oxidase subunit IV